VTKTPTTAVQSMTGFARVEGEEETVTWVWEAKSVNGRGLDVRSRVPQGYDRFDPKIRDALRATFARGSISITLTISQNQGSAGYHVNEDMVRSLEMALPKLQKAFPNAAPISMDGLLAMRGLFDASDNSENANQEALDVILTEGLSTVVSGLIAERAQEGKTLQAILTERLDEMRELAAAAKSLEVTRPETIRARFEENIATFLGDRPGLSEERLAQEVALLASKADIREELDRLSAHIEKATKLLEGGGVTGRKLDFLAQEFNRETNTLCAKSGDVELTQIGLALKTSVDQFKEQVQNVE